MVGSHLKAKTGRPFNASSINLGELFVTCPQRYPTNTHTHTAHTRVRVHHRTPLCIFSHLDHFDFFLCSFFAEETRPLLEAFHNISHRIAISSGVPFCNYFSFCENGCTFNHHFRKKKMWRTNTLTRAHTHTRSIVQHQTWAATNKTAARNVPCVYIGPIYGIFSHSFELHNTMDSNRLHVSHSR